MLLAHENSGTRELPDGFAMGVRHAGFSPDAASGSQKANAVECRLRSPLRRLAPVDSRAGLAFPRIVNEYVNIIPLCRNRQRSSIESIRNR